MIYSFLRLLSFLALKIIFCFKTYGRKNIPKEGGFILASNHVSYLDPIALGVACPRKINFMAKQELFKNRLWRWFFFSIRTYPLKRKKADISALKRALLWLKDGCPMVLFPEGSRGASDNVHSGIGFLAAKAKVPVIPAYIKGSDQALPKGARFIRPAKISLYFGSQMCFGNDKPYEEIAKSVMESINQLKNNL